MVAWSAVIDFLLRSDVVMRGVEGPDTDPEGPASEEGVVRVLDRPSSSRESTSL